MNKIESHLSLIVINTLLIIINFNLLAFNAYPNDSNVPFINIICSLVASIIWIIYGFEMGKKSKRDFICFILIYWILACFFMIFSYKLSNYGTENFIVFLITAIAAISYIPLCPFSLLVTKYLMASRIIELVGPVTLLVILSIISYYIGRCYKKNFSLTENILS